MLKSAIIGCGAIATVHKRVLMSLDEAELVACCDIIPERAKEYAGDIGINPYVDAEEMLRNERPDVVHICVPHPLHTPLARLCVESGAHVFTEKPPVVNMEQWNIFSHLSDGGKYVGICFQNRYNSSVKKVKGLLSSGEFGKILGARAFLTWNRTSDYYLDSSWRGDWNTEGGGVLINQAIHTLDLLVHLFGTVEDVHCHMSNNSLRGVIEVEDTTEAYIVFQSGVKACFYATNAYCINAPVLLEVVTEQAILRIEGNDLTVQRNNGLSEKIEVHENPQFEKDYWGNSHYDCIKDFYRAIIEKRSYSNDIEHVKDTMQLMNKMYESYVGLNMSQL